MKIQYASDLHLEFPQNKEFIKGNPLQKSGDILLLAGDIVPFPGMDKQADFFDYVSDNFQFVYWIPGNHEYYRSDIAERSGTINEKIRSNVFLVNNFSIVHDQVKFIFSTLWSRISPGNRWIIEQFLNDFHLIKYNGNLITAEHFNQFHSEDLQFLHQELLKKNEDKILVVTHHAPTFMNYPEKYKESKINEAFAVELFPFIEHCEADYWIYGHTHFNTPGFRIGKTQLLTNQLGYVNDNEHFSFNNKASFMI